MDDLVARISAETGVEPDVARKAVTVILKFLMAEGPPDKVVKLVEAIPGAREAITNGDAVTGGVMGVFNQLTSAGLGMGDIQSVARSFIAYAKEKAGAATVDDVVNAIPGLSQFV